MIGQLAMIGAEHVADTGDDWYTPRWIFNHLGLTFDIDVAAPVAADRRTCPARRYLTPLEDGLTQPWNGLIWMNPPWSGSAPWVDRFTAHPDGIALLPLHKSAWLWRLLPGIDALMILDVEYTRPDGVTGHMRWPSILAARGETAMMALAGIPAPVFQATGP